MRKRSSKDQPEGSEHEEGAWKIKDNILQLASRICTQQLASMAYHSHPSFLYELWHVQIPQVDIFNS